LALFRTLGSLRVEGVSPSDRGQDARDTIGFVFAKRVFSTWRGRPALVLFRKLALFRIAGQTGAAGLPGAARQGTCVPSGMTKSSEGLFIIRYSVVSI
jgi:hypothetical protein